MGNPNLNGDNNLTAADKEFENNIRPSHIKEFAGQDQIIENLKILSRLPRSGEALDIYCFMALRDWARPPCQGS
jgi:Holliday junction DNA helicase RuvB